jgi:hypothetical protein
MMGLDAQPLLALALVGVYLVDSIHWLRLGEAVVTTRAGLLRRVSFGSPFEFGGRRPFLPNPLTPFWPEVRADWVNAAGNPEGAQVSGREMRERASALRIIGILSTVCGGAIVIGAPLALVLGQERVFVACVLVCVVTALASATFLYRSRSVLGLSLGQWLLLALVAIVCLPCSANLARAAAKAHTWTLPAYQIARLELTGVEAGKTREQLKEALLAAQRYVGEESVEFRGLSEQLRLLEEGP